MSDKDFEKQPPDDEILTRDDVYQEMEPFEPYTLNDLLQRVSVSKGRLWSLLRSLHQARKIRKDESEPNKRIWV